MNATQEKATATPGPWKVTDGGPEALWVQPMDADANVICDLVGRHEGGKIITEEDEANARLIAAAPDLYAAAKMWAKLGVCAFGYATNRDCDCDWHKAVRAVSKAEGSSL